jgi:hemolysin-activating ACP:hemolysin acyltransferase
VDATQITGINAQLAPALGRIMSVILISPQHARMPVGEIGRRILPPLAAKQYVLAEAKPQGQELSAPIGVAFWARLSEEAERRLAADPTKPTLLLPNEWNSGPNLWLIEAIGTPRVIDIMVRQLLEGPFQGQPFKVRRRTGETFVIETVDPRRVMPPADGRGGTG